MTHRPYPNADRALRQLDRHAQPAPPQPSEFEQRWAQQANAVFTVMGEALRPLTEQLVQAGAPRSASLTEQLIIVAGAQLKAECARSAPGVLLMHQMAQQVRRRA